MIRKKYHRVLTIAGSDSGGGAGIQADLKTFSALGCYGMSAITALTAQNTVAVTQIHEVPPAFVAAQIDAVIEDIGVDAVKIGMLSSPEIIEIVASRLEVHQVNKIVLDPVMVAKSGDKLLKEEAIQTLKSRLIPMATIITPNIPEAEVLTGMIITSPEDAEQAAHALSNLGPEAILIKGGHSSEEVSRDVLLLKNPPQMIQLMDKRIITNNTHGTGCTLSSAIAANLAKGLEVLAAVQAAKAYISKAIAAGAAYEIGSGHGPVLHFFEWWDNDIQKRTES